MPTRRPVALLLAMAALLLGPAAACAATPKLSPTPPPGLESPHSSSHTTVTSPAGPGGALPHTGTDLPLQAATAAALLAGGSLLRLSRRRRH